MRRSKTLEFMNNLNEKINKDNIEINKAIANPNLGKNKDRIKQAGYDIDYDGDYIKNPKTGKGIWPKDYNKDEKKKIDFKGKLDSERKPMSKTNRYNWDQEENKIPKSAKIGSKNNNGIFNSDEVEYYSPNWADAPKKSISTNINFYKRAVKDRDDAKKSAESNKKSLGYYEKKVKDAQKSLDWQKDYIKSKEKEADWAEQKRKELVAKTKEKKSATVKEGAESLIKNLKKKINESTVEEQEKRDIENKIEDKEKENNGLSDKIKATPIKDLTGEEAHKIEQNDKEIEDLKNKLKDETLTEARQEEILNKVSKLKKVNETDEQTLNEETVGEKITSPSGKFYVGDPCYVLSDDIYYGIWDDKYDFKDGKIDVDDTLSFLVHGTAYGDGSYQGSNGSEYGVDSGTLAIIPMDLVAKLDGVQFGSVETSNTAWLDYNDGIFDITLDNGSFSIITSEDEEEEDDE